MHPSAFLWRLQMLLLLITSRHTYVKKWRACPGKCCSCLTNQVAQVGIKRDSEPGRGEILFLSPAHLVSESQKLAKKRCKTLVQGYCFQTLLTCHSSATKACSRWYFQKYVEFVENQIQHTKSVSCNQRGFGDPAESERAACLMSVQFTSEIKTANYFFKYILTE